MSGRARRSLRPDQVAAIEESCEILAVDILHDDERHVIVGDVVARARDGVVDHLKADELTSRTDLLDGLEPDRIEVSDRSTLRWTGRWARQRGVGRPDRFQHT